MTLLRDAPATGPLSLLDLPDPAPARYVLVVVAFPGDEVEVMTGRTVTASGETLGRWEPVPTEDGAGCGLALDVPVIWLQDNAQVRIARDGEYTAAFAPRLSERAAAVEDAARSTWPPCPIRGAYAASSTRPVLWEAVHYLVGTFGSHPERWASRSSPAGRPSGVATSTLLVGATLPSGATVGFLAAYPNALPDPVATRVSVTMTATAPAGTALLDRVFAVGLADAFIVSGPSAGCAGGDLRRRRHADRHRAARRRRRRGPAARRSSRPGSASSTRPARW